MSRASSLARNQMMQALRRYWTRGTDVLESLPVAMAAGVTREPLPPLMQGIPLPEWAADLMPEGKSIPVPAHLVADGEVSAWMRTDWWQTAYWYLNCNAERAFENAHGPIHSYSMRLADWDAVIWERAWVNRIALFLRRWAARQQKTDEVEIFGELPQATIMMTHDVDAIEKTAAIRLKQSAFNAFNGMRRLMQGRFPAAIQKFKQSFRFFFSREDYWSFEKIALLEEKYGLRSCFNLYGGGGGWHRSLKKILFDPAYDVASRGLPQTMRSLAERGWKIGVHQSFDAWSDGVIMRRERERVEKAMGQSVTTCRQHWLRFSWLHTWKAQQAAGFLLDTTLGFNDRPGFRCGAALAFTPLALASGCEPCKGDLRAMPMVLMDSHLYDYLDLPEAERQRQMQLWLDEVWQVGGEASVIWHTHVLANDYGWNEGFKKLVELLGHRTR